jgi:hypothetical protein
VPTPLTRLAGGIAAPLAAVAVAAVTALPAAAAPGTTTPTPTAGTGGCVGLVVDSGRGEPTTACVAPRDGMTGQDVLVAAGHELTFDKNGFICRIDGYPDTCTSDNTHYWGYYHRAPGTADGTWEFSQEGAGTYTVHPGETEGWAYQNGTQREPSAVPYATLVAAAKAKADSATVRRAAEHDGGNGSVWTVVVVLAVIVVLGAAAAGVTLRRRNAS